MILPQQLVESELNDLADRLGPVPGFTRREIKRFLRTAPWVVEHFRMWERFIEGCNERRR